MHRSYPAIRYLSRQRATRHLTIQRAPQRHRTVWLFDLDNTLHSASFAIFPHINRMMTEYVERMLQVDRATADWLRGEYTRRYGATLTGLVRHHRVDAHHFLREVHHFDHLAPLLRHERGLRSLLQRLPGRKIIVTNGPRDYAHQVLRELGISRLFERVIGIEHMRIASRWRAKPDRSMLRRALRLARVRVADAILVEDTRGHLKSYKRLGLRTVWMTGHLRSPVTQLALPTPSKRNRPPSRGRPLYVDQRIGSLKLLRAGRKRSQQHCFKLPPFGW